MNTRTDGELFYQILVGGGDRSAMPDFGPSSDAGWPEERIWKMVRYLRLFAESDSTQSDSTNSDSNKSDFAK